ncbi:MAG: hypothetical protein H8D26_04505 [Methanomicrobia archaeon]|nr:hypothetical protein [Methanomicrobia archaeon]
MIILCVSTAIVAAFFLVTMKLHLVEKPEELITIPEASIPSIEVVKVVKR